MASIFITGSADGLGLLAAGELIRLGHKVVLHARNQARAEQALQRLPDAAEILTADLSSMKETIALAGKVNELGNFDAVIHNAGIYKAQGNTPEGLPVLFVVNSLAPYILTALINKPKRLVYLSSGMHFSADPALSNLDFSVSGDRPEITYSDTKLHDLILAKAIARRWPAVYSNALHPGWVPTKMGGASAPDDLVKGYETQVWLAVSEDEEAKVSGRYFHHKKQSHYLHVADHVGLQEKLLSVGEKLSGLRITG